MVKNKTGANPMDVRVEVTTPKSSYKWDFNIFKSENVDEQRIEAEEFYKKWNEGKVHLGTHYEMQILSEELISQKKLHIHPSLKFQGESYVCWTNHIPTFDSAIHLLKIWCAGTAYSIENEVDFGQLYLDKNDGIIEYLKEEFGINVEFNWE